MGNRLSDYRQELMQLIEEGELGICSAYRGNPYHASGGLPYFFRNSEESRNEFDAGARYLALTPSPREIQMADALGLLDAPQIDGEDHQSTFIFTTTKEALGRLRAENHVLFDLIDSLEVVYDSDEHPELVPSQNTGWRSVMGSYSGDVPSNVAYFACRNRVLTAANQFWRSHSIVDKFNPRKTVKELKSLKKSENLVNALLIGHKHAHLTQRRGKVKDGTRNTLLSIEYLSENLPEEVQATTEAMRMFDDFSRLWTAALDDANIALALTEENLLDADALLKTMSELADFTIMGDYVNTYLAGVPADDILA